MKHFFNNLINISIYVFILIIFIQSASPQHTLYDFGFERNFDISVVNQSGDTLPFAWFGGINNIYFSSLDINQNGIDDILIFEKHGNKLHPFINQGIEGKFSYTYMPEYRDNFPEDISEWVIFADFNNNGKQDLFTYATGGIRLFENVSENGELRFQLYSPLLKSKQYENYVNIFLTNVDMPIIDDIDGDGDLDILSFGVLGMFVEWHKNMGVELHSNPDTLDFHRVSRCWGNFMEDENSNEVTLNAFCPWNKNCQFNKSEKDIMHVGSTMLFFDTNGDGLKDLLLGDMDFSNIVLLLNGGSSDSAHFVSQQANFPQNTKSINLFSMPVISYIDINNDGIKELLASPFDPSYYINESKKSVWLYHNHGRNDSLDLEFIQDNFLQDMMIEHGSGAYPVLFDYNGNGSLDLFIANYGVRDTSYYEFGYLYSTFISTIALYENTGTSIEPAFTLLTEDFANLSQYQLLSIYPTFGDIDGDGDIDMILGNKDGRIWFFENTSGNMQSMNLILADSNYFQINAGTYTTPQLFDLNKNGKLDLIVGNRAGKLVYYQNNGTTSQPQFDFVTDFLGGISTADLNYSYSGHSVPCFYRDANGKTSLFTGSNKGWLLYFSDIDNNLNGIYTLKDTLFIVRGTSKRIIDEGIYTAPFVSDINNDGYLDMLVGNFCGGLSYYKGTHPPADTVFVAEMLNPEVKPKVYPNPFSESLGIEYNKRVEGLNISLYNIVGQEILKTSFKNTNFIEIETHNLPQGLYILHIEILQNEKLIYKYSVKVMKN
jgi:hypothetical protein